MSLTEEQVANWRKALIRTLGPYALIMSKREIEELAKWIQIQIQLQATAAMPPAILVPRYCECDRSYYGATTGNDGVCVCNQCKRERQ